jgi:hypothetical protein
MKKNFSLFPPRARHSQYFFSSSTVAEKYKKNTLHSFISLSSISNRVFATLTLHAQQNINSSLTVGAEARQEKCEERARGEMNE